MQRFNRHGRKGVLHFIEINVRNWAQAFKHDAYARIAAVTLREYCDNHPAKLIAYVIMPSHIHAILNPRDGRINKFLGQYKPAVTVRVAEIAISLGATRIINWLRQPDGHMQLWQESKHNFHLYSERLIWQKINYIHSNPIRAGLANTMDDYPYSSFRAMYQTGSEIIIPVDHEFWWDDEPDLMDDNEILL